MVQTAELRETEKRFDLGLKNYNDLLELLTDDGILASSRQEKYGCVFGRDTAITILGILSNLENPPIYVNPDLLLQKSKIGLLKLAELQGREINIESGEEPGKIPHEYRESNYERLVNRPKGKELGQGPWFVYPDGKLRNYDSIDATQLWLIAVYKLWERTRDNKFLLKVLPSVERALNWIFTYGDKDSDRFTEFGISPKRIHGGLRVQNWMDSVESLTDKNGNFPKYLIAPVEVQGMTWLSLKLWADFYKNSNLNFPNNGLGWREFGRKLETLADEMKIKFNKTFLYEDSGLVFAGQALDGDKKLIKEITVNPALLLWMTFAKNGKREAIIENKYINDIVKRIFMPDMLHPLAGIRTKSTKSSTHNPNQNSYHDGSVWGWTNGAIFEGLTIWGFRSQTKTLGDAMVYYAKSVGPGTELVVPNGNKLLLYQNDRGDTSCRQQAFAAAYAPWKLLT